MHIRNWKRALPAAGLALAALAGSGMAANASTATISTTASQTVKGWGAFPSYFRSDWGANYTTFSRPAIQDAIYAVGLTFIRVDVEPRLYVSGNTVSNMVLDSTAVSDLVSQINIARNHGVTQYIMSCWSPPAVWKDNGSINGGHLTAAGEPAYVAYYTKVIQTLNSNGVGLPLAISVQNEPDINAGYDSCVYTDTSANQTLWRTLVKDMRASFNANGLSAVSINGPEGSNTDTDQLLLGGDNFPQLTSDSTLNTALGTYASHTYGECDWTPVKTGIAAHPKDAFITEWSIIDTNSNYGTTEINWATGAFRHFASNMVDIPYNYWCHWNEWQYGTSMWNNPLLTGDTTPIYSKRYWIFQKLWTNVRPGWIVHKMTCDDGNYVTSNSANIPWPPPISCDTMVDMVAFQDSGATKSAVLLINKNAGSTSMVINGLKGATYTAYQTTSSADMTSVGSGSVSGGSATVTLPSMSVTVVLTQAGSPPPAPTGLTATGGNAQVALSWNASAGATAYDVKRSTVSGSGYATVSSPTTTTYTNTGLTNGTTYYFVVDAKNANGTSANSSQASATPSAGSSGPVKINAAGPAVSPFVADVDFSGGTTATNWTGAIDTSGVTSPAPQAVYQSERYGAMTYTMSGLTSGTNYTVRLHFCENYFTATAQRKFNVAINGTTVLTNFDIYATTGAIHKANVQQFTAAANGSGQIVVAFTNVTNNALVNGIEVNTISSGNTHGGTWAEKGVLTTTATWLKIWQVANVASNSTYTASFWMKGAGGVVLIINNGSWGTELKRQTFTATSTWTQYSFTLSTAANTQLTMSLSDGAGVAGTVYIDDTFLGIANGTNTLGNPGFESGNTVWTVDAGGPWSILQNP